MLKLNLFQLFAALRPSPYFTVATCLCQMTNVSSLSTDFLHPVFCLLGFSFAAAVPAAKNPVHALMSLISLFLIVTFFIITLEQEYLALLIAIVQIGAVSILFLFVIILLDVKKLNTVNTQNPTVGLTYATYGTCCFAVLVAVFSINILKSDNAFASVAASSGHPFLSVSASAFLKQSSILLFASTLYTVFCEYVLLLTLLLLLALLGAIILALETNKNPAISIISCGPNFKFLWLYILRKTPFETYIDNQWPFVYSINSPDPGNGNGNGGGPDPLWWLLLLLFVITALVVWAYYSDK